MTGWLTGLWVERAPGIARPYGTLAIIAYRQPVTGVTSSIRGVGVTTNMRSLLERNWIHVGGFGMCRKTGNLQHHREFLDYFGVKKLDDLPPLAELKDLESFTAQLELADAEALPAGAGAPLVVREDDDPDESELELATVTPITSARACADDEPASNVVPLKAR